MRLWQLELLTFAAGHLSRLVTGPLAVDCQPQGLQTALPAADAVTGGAALTDNTRHERFDTDSCV